jgi:Cu2+-exporting ATPase
MYDPRRLSRRSIGRFPRVGEVRLLSGRANREQCMAAAAALERHSEHPISRAFDDAGTAAVTDVRSSPGRGIEGRVDEVIYRIGRVDYVGEICASRCAAPTAEDARSSVFLGDTEGPLAEFVLEDGLRGDALAAVEGLRALGLEPSIASGDRTRVVAEVARQLGVAPASGDLRSGDKVAFVRSLQSQGHVVAMVGDGVNDAPVLAGADVSVAIGGGTDLAKVSADVVLLGEALAPLCVGVETARRCMHVIRQNMAWAILYNATAVPLAASGWFQPWMAAIGMSASSLLVVLNAARLLAERPRPGLTAADVPVKHAPRIAPA